MAYEQLEHTYNKVGLVALHVEWRAEDVHVGRYESAGRASPSNRQHVSFEIASQLRKL